MKFSLLFVPALVFFSNQCFAQNKMADAKVNDTPFAKNIILQPQWENPKENKTKTKTDYTIEPEIGTNHIYKVNNIITKEERRYQSIGKVDRMNIQINDTIALSDKVLHFYKGIYKGKKNGKILLFIDNKEEEIPEIARFLFKEYEKD
ncbi:hypothetical protein [Sphingobacterium faecium]|uniref:hypothetical protein n=1 Tax=Sphingobacterium faecium TaxID=34087 RepID=UPI00246894B2|nr:hypothetical protein [Sphingobacterium faecium]MDH5828871.1 hypothetical protein [Sphingobacterium faecium]WGQ17002.1 hypothetical protein QG727_22765 [Sphingobacterium faecium]